MRFVYFIDRINTFIGKAVAWSILALTFAVCYEVFSRYVLRAPTEWAFDASYMLYGLLFMVAGPYALARNNHVRGDFLYRNWPPRRQAGGTVGGARVIIVEPGGERPIGPLFREAHAPQPFDAVGAVIAGHEEAQRKAVLGRQRRAVQLIGQEDAAG